MAFRKLLTNSFLGCPTSFVEVGVEPITTPYGVVEYQCVERDICSAENNLEIPVDSRTIANMIANNQPLTRVSTLLFHDSAVPNEKSFSLDTASEDVELTNHN